MCWDSPSNPVNENRERPPPEDLFRRSRCIAKYLRERAHFPINQKCTQKFANSTYQTKKHLEESTPWISQAEKSVSPSFVLNQDFYCQNEDCVLNKICNYHFCIDRKSELKIIKMVKGHFEPLCVSVWNISCELHANIFRSIE